LCACPCLAFLFVLGVHGGLLEGFLRLLVRLGRVFHRLLGVLVPGLVIFLAVMRRGNAMRVRGKLVHLSGSLVRIVCHECSRTAEVTVAICGSDVHGDRSEIGNAGVLDLHGARGYAEPNLGECVMKFRAFGILVAGIALSLAASGPARAHHSFGVEYDVNKPVSLTGTVTSIEWTNPHCFIYVDVKDKDGKVTNWKMEGFPPSVLYRAGWRRDVTVKVGDEITMTGWQSRVGGPWGHSREVTLKDGRKFYFGPPPGTGDGGNGPGANPTPAGQTPADAPAPKN